MEIVKKPHPKRVYTNYADPTRQGDVMTAQKTVQKTPKRESLQCPLGTPWVSHSGGDNPCDANMGREREKLCSMWLTILVLSL